MTDYPIIVLATDYGVDLTIEGMTLGLDRIEAGQVFDGLGRAIDEFDTVDYLRSRGWTVTRDED